MKRRSERENLPVVQPVEQDLAGLVSKMQQQLISLEAKIDTLINRPQAQPQQRSFEQRSFAPRSFDRPRYNDRQQRNSFKVICADCNKECEIPFKPSPGRPVYCRECFSKHKSNSNVFKPRRENNIVERDFTHDREPAKKKIYKKKKRA